MQQWISEDFHSKLGSKAFYILYNNISWKISLKLFEQILGLHSGHWETDTRCFLHAKYAANKGVSNILIICEYTDAADIGSQIFMKSEPLVAPESYTLMRLEPL